MDFHCNLCKDTVNAITNIPCRALGCGHLFHPYCIHKLFQAPSSSSRAPACPLCGQTIIGEEIIDVVWGERAPEDVEEEKKKKKQNQKNRKLVKKLRDQLKLEEQRNERKEAQIKRMNKKK